MTEMKKTRKRKAEGPFSDELLDELLSQLKGKDAESLLCNHRNESSPKTVITPEGPPPLDIPRDRRSTLEAVLVAKHQRRLPEFNDRVTSMYARGMPVREIQAHLEEIYGLEVSPDLISSIPTR